MTRSSSSSRVEAVAGESARHAPARGIVDERGLDEIADVGQVVDLGRRRT